MLGDIFVYINFLYTTDMHSQEFTQKMKERLLEEKERITDELSQLHEHTEMGPGPTDATDYDANAQEINVDEVSQDIMAQLEEDLVKIDKALVKTEDGTYGMTDSGEQISESRLEVLPWADTTVH